MRRCSGSILASGFLLATACNGSTEGTPRACVTIGDAGGTVTSTDDVLTIAIRPGALDESVEVCISPADAPPDGPPPVFGPAYRVRPDMELTLNATITYHAPLPSDPTGVAVGVILREDFEAGRGRWLSLPVTRLEPENELVAGSDPGLSMYYGLCAAGDCEGEIPDPTDGTTTDETAGSTSASATAPSTSTTDGESTDTMGVLTDDSTTGDPSETSRGSSSDGSSSDSSDTTPVLDCDDLPAPPFDIIDLGNVFPQQLVGIGSEDFAMTGDGTFIGAAYNVLLESDADGNTTEWFSPVSAPLFGLRFDAYGDLLGVNATTEDIDLFTMTSQELWADTNFTMGNGIYPDNEGNVWATDLGGNRIVRVNSDLSIDTISDTSMQPNGIFFDEDRSLLFWTRYGTSELHSIPIDGAGDPGADALVVNLDGSTDGITMDVCGHIYAVDQAGGGGMNPCRVDRVHLDDAGALAAEGVVEIAGGGELGNGCSNAQFGYGFGDENDQRLFVTGLLGDVYVIDVGVEGYPIPL